jgi:hypothetical protein
MPAYSICSMQFSSRIDADSFSLSVGTKEGQIKILTLEDFCRE